MRFLWIELVNMNPYMRLMKYKFYYPLYAMHTPAWLTSGTWCASPFTQIHKRTHASRSANARASSEHSNVVTCRHRRTQHMLRSPRSSFDFDLLHHRRRRWTRRGWWARRRRRRVRARGRIATAFSLWNASAHPNWIWITFSCWFSSLLHKLNMNTWSNR